MILWVSAFVSTEHPRLFIKISPWGDWLSLVDCLNSNDSGVLHNCENSNSNLPSNTATVLVLVFVFAFAFAFAFAARARACVCV